MQDEADDMGNFGMLFYNVPTHGQNVHRVSRIAPYLHHDVQYTTNCSTTSINGMCAVNTTTCIHALNTNCKSTLDTLDNYICT